MLVFDDGFLSSLSLLVTGEGGSPKSSMLTSSSMVKVGLGVVVCREERSLAAERVLELGVLVFLRDLSLAKYYREII